MFHVKQRRRLAGFLGLVALSLLVLSCSRAAAPRGWAAPVGLDSLVLVSTSRGHLTAINASSREKVWRFPDCWSISEKRARSLAGIYGVPVVSQDLQTLFIGDYSGYVYAVPTRGYDCDSGASDKAKVGAFKLDDHIIGGLALDTTTDTLYVTSGPRIYSLPVKDLKARADNNKANVALKEIYKADGDIWSAPIMTGTGLLFSSLDGKLYMFGGQGRVPLVARQPITWSIHHGGYEITNT